MIGASSHLSTGRPTHKPFGAKFYTAQPSYDWVATYNAAPSQLLPIIRTHHENRIELAKWGFVREDWKNIRIRPQNNARLETADEKSMFHASFRARHCLVLADSFYEWKTLEDGRKQPYRIMLKSSEPFAMAGIYARGRDHQIGDAENTTATFAILTTAANELMQPIHERMPVSRCIKLRGVSLKYSQGISASTLCSSLTTQALENSCHIALGWPVPKRIVDLFAEFGCVTKGKPPMAGNGLLGALAHFGLDGIGWKPA
jgi:putative SOS response-associated peptidase YedK